MSDIDLHLKDNSSGDTWSVGFGASYRNVSFKEVSVELAINMWEWFGPLFPMEEKAIVGVGDSRNKGTEVGGN